MDKFDFSEWVSREIKCLGISSELWSMELEIMKSLSFKPYFVTFTDFLLAFLNLYSTLAEKLNSTNFELEIQSFYFSFVQSKFFFFFFFYFYSLNFRIWHSSIQEFQHFLYLHSGVYPILWHRPSRF